VGGEIGLEREYLYFSCLACCIVYRVSSVGIGLYWLFGPVVQSSWRRDFLLPFRPTLGSTQRSVQWVSCLFHGGKMVMAWR
jgi:hypothetical protein